MCDGGSLMPAPSIGRRERWLPEQSDIDWDHPMASGLRLCLVGDRWVDLVTGHRPNPAGQGVNGGPMGRMRSYNGTAGSSIPLDLTGVINVSIGVVVLWPAYAADDALLLEFSANSNSNDGFRIDPNESSLNKLAVLWRIADSRAYLWTRPTAAVVPTWTFDLPFNGVPLAYSDGTPMAGQQEGVANAQSGSYGASTLYLASRAGSSLLATCSIGFLCIWDGLRGIGGAQAFHSDPFQMLRY